MVSLITFQSQTNQQFNFHKLTDQLVEIKNLEFLKLGDMALKLAILTNQPFQFNLQYNQTFHKASPCDNFQSNQSFRFFLPKL